MAYLTTIECLYDSYTPDTNANEYLAFDFSDVQLDNLQELKDAVQVFCEQEGFTYMEASMDELIEMGYVSTYEMGDETAMATSFEDGVLFEITTVSQSSTTLVTEMSIWKGNLGAYGATFTAVFDNGNWTVTLDNLWIS